MLPPRAESIPTERNCGAGLPRVMIAFRLKHPVDTLTALFKELIWRGTEMSGIEVHGVKFTKNQYEVKKAEAWIFDC